MNAIAVKGPLIGRFVPEDNTGRIVALAGFAILGTLILWASAKVSVPFWPVPMTLQTGAVALIAAAYGWRLGLATVVPLPLRRRDGPASIPGHAGARHRASLHDGDDGRLPSRLRRRGGRHRLAREHGFDRNPLKLFGAMLVGDAIVFVLGFTWLAWFALLSSGDHGIGAASALSAGVVPFILGDLVKLALAACLVSAGAYLVRR